MTLNTFCIIQRGEAFLNLNKLENEIQNRTPNAGIMVKLYY